MLKKRLIVALCCFCIVSCSSTRLMPGYRGIDAGNNTLGVVLVKHNVEVLNPEDVAECLGGGIAEQSFYDFFASEFPAKMEKYSKFRKIVFARGADERLDRGMSDARPDIVMTLPPGRRFFSDSLGYLLIIDLLTITRIRKDGSQMTSEGSFITGFRGGADDLVFSAMFTLWDNTQGAVAVYGTIRQKTIPFVTLNRTVWAELLEKMAAGVVAGMPYRK